MTEITDEELARLRAADETCFSVLLVISLGGLDGVDLEWRRFIADAGLQDWAEMSAEAGLINKDKPEENEPA